MPFGITVLVENMATGRGIRGEHGLCFWLEQEARAMLFDCGASDLLVSNASVLGLDWGKLEAIALSHGHCDHTGGLKAALEQHKVVVHAHPDVWTPHRVRGRGRLGAIAPPLSFEETGAIAEISLRKTPVEVMPGMWLSGEIPREHPLEPPSGDYRLALPGNPPDPLLDDQAMILEDRDGIALLLGCAHSGVLNTLNQARRLFPGKRLKLLAGGLHLLGASAERLEATALALKEADRVVAGHCTGWKACFELQRQLGERFGVMHCGQRLST